MRSHCGWYRKAGRRGCATERLSRLQELRQGRILRAGGQEAWPEECLAALSLEHLKHTPAFIAPLRSPFLSTKKPVCLSLVLPPEASGPATPQHTSLPPYHGPSFHGTSAEISLDLLSNIPLPPSQPPFLVQVSGKGVEGPSEPELAMETHSKRATSPDTIVAFLF